MDDIYEFEFDVSIWEDLRGHWIEEADVYAAGMKWRVHLNDADPFPSCPHAHCVNGQPRFVGSKLHLGTGVLYKDKLAIRKLPNASFHELIEKIRPKFPTIELPLAS
jgi:hypothetical protein